MKTNNTLLGVKSPGDELVIRNFKRLTRQEETVVGLYEGGPVWKESREVILDAWSGKTTDDLSVHVAYRFGEVTVEVDLPIPSGGTSPLTVLRWKPRLALGLAAPSGRLFGAESAVSREEKARLAELSAELSEVRALNGKPRLLGESELRHWLAERNRHFTLLSERGLAGGKLRFRFESEKEEGENIPK